jgi:hypothetical protein
MTHKVFYPFVAMIFVFSLNLVPVNGAASTVAQVAGSNLIVNGDFESGNTGFSTVYTFSPGDIFGPATYDILSNPNSAHASAASFGDHTSGSGLMMAINGSDLPGQVVWSQAVPVTANTDYEFSAWITSWFLVSPAQLEFRINGSQIGIFTTTRISGEWEQFAVGWNSGNSTLATIEIMNSNTVLFGNDLAIDDLTLQNLPCQSNILINNNFESGNTGFSSGYTFTTGNITAGATYDVVSNPNNSHASAVSFGDHTSGSGLMLAANGATSPGLVVWSQTVPVAANTDHEFSAWVASWYFASPAQLEFRINGTSVGTFTAPPTSGTWQQFNTTWNSGASTSAVIEIIDLNTADSGNDFALDDLAFRSLSACGTPTNTPTNTPTSSPGPSCPSDLLINGDFESGNTGFSSGYTFTTGNITAGATYDVVSNPNNSHASAASFGDHTSGSGLMMAANGATSLGLVVWSQTVPVTANTDHEFSAWVASWYFASPAQLELRINGTSVGTFTAPPTSGTWQQFNTTWNSGASTSAVIEIIDLNTADSGNDFALDDLVLHSLGDCVATNTPTSAPTNTPTTTATATPTGSALPGQLKLCKKIGSDIPIGQIFVIQVNTVSYNVPAGYCVLAGTYTLNTNVTIQEIVPAGYYVGDITVLPSARQVSQDKTTGQVVVKIGSGVTEVLYQNGVLTTGTPTNTPTRTPTPTPGCSPNCTPTPTPFPTGRMQICKEADGGGVSGDFVFRYNSKARTVPVGACSLIISVNAGTVTIAEDVRAGFAVSDIYTIPANRLVSKDISNRAATVTIVAGNASTQTIVVFVNRAVTARSMPEGSSMTYYSYVMEYNDGMVLHDPWEVAMTSNRKLPIPGGLSGY